MWALVTWADFLSLRAVYAYKLPQAVPVNGCATYQEIASASSISEVMARRFLRHAMTNHIFAQSSSDKVRHTAASRLMVTDPDFFDAVGLETSELGPTSQSILDAVSNYGDSDEQNETAFSLANGTDLGIYQFLGKNPKRARRFGAGMRFFTKDEGWNLKHLVAGFNWASIDHPGRIDFVAHDFFAEAPKKAPDVYLFRWIFHNWSDGYCVKILRNLTPSLEDGTRVLIYENVLNDDPETRLTEKMGLNLDVIMKACFNSAERTKAQWSSLLHTADERFVVQNIVRPEGSTMSIIEVVWKIS